MTIEVAAIYIRDNKNGLGLVSTLGPNGSLNVSVSQSMFTGI